MTVSLVPPAPRAALRGTFASLTLLLGAAAAAAAPISIHGRIEGERGEALRDAVVWLYPQIGLREAAELQLAGNWPPAPKVEANIRADGEFAVDAPGPGVWRLVASAPGRAETEATLRPLVEETWLPPAVLAADAPLTVTVVDSAGKPVVGAAVVAHSTLDRFGVDWTPVAARLLASADGKAVVHRAAKTRLSLTVAAKGHAVAKVENVGGSAHRVALLAGTPRELRVTGADGRAIEGALVTALPGGAPLGTTDRAGKLALMTAGAASPSLTIEDRAGASARITVEPAKANARTTDERAVAVRLERPLAVAGRVIDAQSRQPLAGAVVLDSNGDGWAVTDGAGAYTLDGVRAQGATLHAAAAGHTSASIDALDGRAPTLALEPATALVGSVVDGKGRPIAGVDVAAAAAPTGGGRRFFRQMGMRGGRPLQTRTDERGRYRLAPLVTAVPHQVTFRRKGFAPLDRTVPPAPRDRTAELHVTMLAGARGFGRVVTLEGAAIAGAKVTLQRQEERDMRRMMRFGGEQQEKPAAAESDAAGKFAIADLAVGKFVLRVEADGYAATSVPGIEVPADAGEVDLGTVKLTPGAAIEGRVVGPRGEPLEGAEVFVLDGMAAMMPQVRWALMGKDPASASAADGFFRVGERAAGEKVDLAVRLAGYTVERVLGVAAPTTEPVTVTLRPSSTVRGRVVDEDGDPVVAAEVSLLVERAGGGMAFQIMTGSEPSGDDGRFAIEDVEPGPLRLMVAAQGYLPFDRGGLEVPVGKDLEGLELVLRAGATVEGRVSSPDGAPVIGANVRVMAEGQGGPLPPMRMMSRGADTDGDGHYRLEGVEVGSRTLEAEHEDFERGVGSLEVKAGENHLDLRMGGGQEVSGRVVSAAGAPVSGATVTIAPPGQYFRDDRSATTDEAGSFSVTGVPDGSYEAAATHPDYADGRAAATVTVAGAPVGGVTIELPAGSAVVGALRGLSLAELSRTRVTASQPGKGWRDGTVSYDARYRIAGLAPGDWNVSARLEEGGRQARGRVTIAAGEGEATLDLDFEGGLALRGHVRQDGRAVDAAYVLARGKDVVASGSARADHAGAYRMENLKPGSYDVEVYVPESGARKEETVTVDGDRELDFDLRSVRISGRVLEAGSGEPVAGVAVGIQPADGRDEGGMPFNNAASTDDDGRFRFGTMSEGSWRLTAEKSGYARATANVAAGSEAVDDVEIRLSPTQGITLAVSRVAGSPPSEVHVAVLDAGRNAVSSGMYPTAENGRVRISTVPAGTWEVLVRSDDSGTVRVLVTSPGEPAAVVLAPQATLQVNVPAIAGEAIRARVTLTGGDGQRFLFPGWGSVEDDFGLAYGRTTIQFLPAGTWRVEAKASDGRTFTGTVTTTAGGASTVDLE